MKHTPHRFIREFPRPTRAKGQSNIRYAFDLRKYIDLLHAEINGQYEELQQLKKDIPCAACEHVTCVYQRGVNQTINEILGENQ